MKIKGQNLSVCVTFLLVIMFIISTSVSFADEYGACCIKLDDNISCLMTTPEECAAQMGWTKFQGLDSDCLDNPCIPDCGDINFDGNIDILDVLYSIGLLYKCFSPPWMFETADVDGSGSVNILDTVYLINAIYKDGAAPICPGLQPVRGSYQFVEPMRDCK